MILEDKKALLACIGASVVTFNVRVRSVRPQRKYSQAFRLIKAYIDAQHSEWIPVGTVKLLQIHPLKSGRRKEFFSIHCDALGASFGEYRDREFMIIDGTTGQFLTARQLPKMILIESEIADGVLTLSTPDGGSVQVVLADVIASRDIKRTTLFDNLQADGIDCGEAVSKLISGFLEQSDLRLVYYRPDLFNGRPCKPQPEWWNNPVPKRNDTVRFVDLAPFMITTEGSLKALNDRLERPMRSANFRANIVVDQSEAWDEDKWAAMRIGDVQLECFAPCTRCILPTVDPEKGVKDPDMQPLKKLREFRLAPEGKMRNAHGQSPVFGVNAGIVKPGYVHIGQTVYVKYKPSAF
ncbi:hypothetical protein PMAYCL1PPCAC_16741 [Pristionchus mayeri]|uniref:MOSC domain-containing protein n=1 Tax=Pristionchus mayeri TaxID=1317129 RepID=A0AAN5I054_9BILA|nr:hypothetical protein PMAYCL1PPCAC_16741 [Pristionchus mayeri]